MSDDLEKLPPPNGHVSNRQLYEGLQALDDRWDRRFERVPTRREMLAYLTGAVVLGQIAGRLGPIQDTVQYGLSALGL
ncbi:MAG: hypothetical protein ACREKH_02120 [Candidatus Rokuibacteriota bacterium]